MGKKRAEPKPVTRLQFLRLLGAGAGLLALTACGGGTSSTSAPQFDPAGQNNNQDPNAPITIYKLSNYKKHCCNACKKHASNKLFSTADLAQANRAHPGCNCEIKSLAVTPVEYETYFSASLIYDKRG